MELVVSYLYDSNRMDKKTRVQNRWINLFFKTLFFAKEFHCLLTNISRTFALNIYDC